MKKYYSYEQFICAILSNFKTNISLNEVIAIMNQFRIINRNAEIGKDVIRFINNYIGVSKEDIWLKTGLDSIVFFDGKTITLKEYLDYIAGPELVEYAKGLFDIDESYIDFRFNI